MVQGQGSKRKRLKKEPFSLEDLSKVFEVGSFDIAPDGKKLVFSWNKTGNFDIYSIPAEGGKAERLTFGEGAKRIPLYSFNGAWVSFLKDFQGNENFDIYLMRPDGSDLHAIIEDPDHCIRSHAWSHDSCSIAFEANFEGTFYLYITKVGEGCPRRIYGPVLFPILRFTPDDKYLVFSSMDVKNLQSEKIYISNLETGETRVLISTGKNTKDGGFIGGVLIFLRTVSGLPLLRTYMDRITSDSTTC